MSRVLIITTDDLKTLLSSKHTLDKDDLIYSFYQKDTMIPVQCINTLMNSDLKISFLEYSEKEDLCIQIGTIIGKYCQDSKICVVDNFISLSKEFAEKHNVEELTSKSLMSEVSKTKTKNNRKKLVQAATSKSTITSTTGKRRGRPPKSKIENIESKKEQVNSSVKSNQENKDFFQLKKPENKLNQNENAEETDKNTSTDRLTETMNNVTASILNSKAKTTDDIIVIFIKQMSVKSTDLIHYVGTNEDLAKDIAGSIMYYKESKEELMDCLLKNFSPEDSSEIYKWIKPNIKKLTELSEQIALQEA